MFLLQTNSVSTLFAEFNFAAVEGMNRSFNKREEIPLIFSKLIQLESNFAFWTCCSSEIIVLCVVHCRLNVPHHRSQGQWTRRCSQITPLTPAIISTVTVGRLAWPLPQLRPAPSLTSMAAVIFGSMVSCMQPYLPLHFSLPPLYCCAGGCHLCTGHCLTTDCHRPDTGGGGCWAPRGGAGHVLPALGDQRRLSVWHFNLFINSFSN